MRDGLEVVEYCRAEGKDVLASNTIVGVAESAFQLGNKRLAVELLAEALEVNRRLDYDIFTGANLVEVTTLLLDAGLYEDALRLSSFATAFALERARMADMSDPFGRAEQERAAMLANLDDTAIERAVTDSERLTPEAAVDQALALLESLEATLPRG